jgi:membrane-associated protein
MPNPGELLTIYGIVAVFAVILLKEAGLPLPVPGDLIMLLAGIHAAQGEMALWQVLLALLAASLIGASVQFHLVRGPGRGLIYRYGRYVGLPATRLDRAAASLHARGARAVALLRITPGIRAVAAIAAGLAGLSYRTFMLGVTAGSLIWILFHTLLGFFAGPVVLTTLQSAHLPVLPVVAGLLILGLLIWLVRRRRSQAGTPEGMAERLRAWTEAGCPACVLIGALEPATEPATERAT